MEQTKTTVHPILAPILKEINVAVRRLGMYPSDHPARSQTVEVAFSPLQEMLKETDQITISLMGDVVIINGLNVENGILPKKLRKEFQNQTINSLTFTNTITREEFAKFLTFFVVALDGQSSKQSLPEFLQENHIDSIKTNQLRYELVSDDEVVVKSQVLEGTDLKAQISKIIKKSPDLVRDIFLNKPVNQESCIERFGSEVNLDQLIQGIHRHVRNLTDDEVLSLLASRFEFALKESEGKDKKSVLNEEVSLVHRLLQDIEKSKLLPEVKRIFSGYGIVEEKYLDFIFEKKWLKSQAVLDELIGLADKLGKEEVDFERFIFLVHRVIDSGEQKIRLYTMDRLLSNLNSRNGRTRRLSILALRAILSRLILGKMEVEFVYLKDRLYNRVEDQLVSANVLKDSTALIRIIFFELIQRKEFEEAKKILSEYNVRLSQEVSYPQEVREVAKDFLKKVSDESTFSILASQLKEGQALKNTKVIEEILESLDKDKVAEKLLEIFAVEDRATRISSLRVLSKLGKSSVDAISRLLSNRHTFLRKEGTQLLIDEHWYKVRNAIYVLGNIPDPQSVWILVELHSDPDLRVRLEVIKALEKIGKEESLNVLVAFLNDREEEVRKNAIASLSSLGDKRCLKSLMDHFHHNPKDRIFVLNAIGKIGGQESTEFLFKLLTEEDPGIKHWSKRQKEDIKITVLNILGKIGSISSRQIETDSLAREIERFIKYRKRGIRALLVKDPLAEAANRALKMIKSRA